VMRDRAAEVPYLQQAPHRMLARAHRRVARNVLASVAAAVIIVAGASAGLASLGALRNDTGPAVSPPATHASTPPPTTDACSATDLRATTALQGAAGSLVGAIHVTNTVSTSCTLTGRPTVTIRSSTGQPLAVTVRDVEPQWQADKTARPQGWPAVRLQPGSMAAIRIAWSNACPQLSGPARWTLNLGAGGTLEVSDPDRTPPPPCNGPTEPSTLQVGPFEPTTS
jgi:hypothetical protein